MSGLAALFHRDGRPVEPAPIRRMLDAVPYRGPDGIAAYHFEAVALGHARMAMTPEEEDEQQPLISPRTGCAVIADVRLDNREDLLARLSDRPATTASDAELILRAYEAWGPAAAEHLLGDFAFVLWDPRRHRLVCARDTSGQRPLFYRVDARTFAAASEIHQLLQDPSVPVEANDERIRDSLAPLNAFQNEKDTGATYYTGIEALPAGHLMLVGRDVLRVRQYWELTPPAELRYRRGEEYAEHYRALFFDVVRARLRSSRPTGVLLSGGLDSSSIACVAQELYRSGRATDRGFASLSVVFEGLECDERGFIEEIRAKYDFPTHYVSCGQYAGRLQLEPRGFREMPDMGVAEVRDAIFGTAMQAGLRALLSGDIADACVDGTHLVFDSLLRHGRLGLFRRHLQAYRRVSRDSPRKIAVSYCVAPLLPLWLQKRIEIAYHDRLLRRCRLPGWMPEPLRADLFRRHRRLFAAREQQRRFSSPARQLECDLLYPPEAARHPVPWPLEIWRPFADRRLHEFLLAIPPEQKFSPHPDTDEFYAGSKRIVRDAMAGILPESIRTRTSKTVFDAAFSAEIDGNWPVYEAAFGPRAHSELAARGYVDQAKFWSRLQKMRSGTSVGDDMFVMRLLDLETWLRALKQPRSELVTVCHPWNPHQGVLPGGGARRYTVSV